MKNYKDSTNIGASQQEEIKNSGLGSIPNFGIEERLNANLQNESQTLDERIHEILQTLDERIHEILQTLDERIHEILQTLDERIHEILDEYKFNKIYIAECMKKIVRWMMKEQSFWNNKDKIEQLIMNILSNHLQNPGNNWSILLDDSMERYPDFWTKEAKVEQFINILDQLQGDDIKCITHLINAMVEYPNFWTKKVNVEQFINISNKLQPYNIFGSLKLVDSMRRYPDFWTNETKIEKLAKVYNIAKAV